MCHENLDLKQTALQLKQPMEVNRMDNHENENKYAVDLTTHKLSANMIFRYYITDSFNGRIEGTNDTESAEELAECEEYFIVDTDTGEWLCAGGERVQIKKRA